MLKIAMSLLIVGIQQWMLSSAVETEEKQTSGEARVIVLSGDKASAGCVAVAGAEPGAGKSVFVVASTGEAGEDGNGKTVRNVIEFRHGHDADAENRGWLGVSIGVVPSAVSSQVGIEGKGILVLNVMGDSPAQSAGLMANDILLAIDGTEIDGSVGHGAQLISRRSPGEEVEITILREGVEQSVKAVLGSRAEMPAFEWKSLLPPSAELDEEIRTKGTVLHFGPEGKWVFKDLGDVAEIEGLPESVRAFLPKAGTSSVRVWEDGEGKSMVRCRVQRDGTSLVIEQEDEGDIAVTRTDDQGTETKSTYASADELRAGDPEAFELFDDASDSAIVKLDIDGIAGIEEIDIDVPDLKKHILQWKSHVGEGVANALKEHEIHLEGLHEHLVQLKEAFGEDALPELFRDHSWHAKPRQSFEVRPDGTIEARLRKGDSELVRTFDDEYDLQQRRPDLYEKYLELTAAEE